jgi:hypothetical protein
VNWGLLQALGAAGLLGLFVIRLPLVGRTIAGLVLLAAYQFLLDRFWLADVIAAPHNGPWGALSWGAMLILATALADLYHREASALEDPERARRVYPWASLAVLGLGLALALVVPVSKHRASASFVRDWALRAAADPCVVCGSAVVAGRRAGCRVAGDSERDRTYSRSAQVVLDAVKWYAPGSARHA